MTQRSESSPSVRLLSKAIRLPSGDHEGERSVVAFRVRLMKSPLATSTTMISHWPSTIAEQAMEPWPAQLSVHSVSHETAKQRIVKTSSCGLLPSSACGLTCARPSLLTRNTKNRPFLNPSWLCPAKPKFHSTPNLKRHKLLIMAACNDLRRLWEDGHDPIGIEWPGPVATVSTTGSV